MYEQVNYGVWYAEFPGWQNFIENTSKFVVVTVAAAGIAVRHYGFCIDMGPAQKSFFKIIWCIVWKSNH